MNTSLVNSEYKKKKIGTHNLLYPTITSSARVKLVTKVREGGYDGRFNDSVQFFSTGESLRYSWLLQRDANWFGAATIEIRHRVAGTGFTARFPEIFGRFDLRSKRATNFPSTFINSRLIKRKEKKKKEGSFACSERTHTRARVKFMDRYGARPAGFF